MEHCFCHCFHNADNAAKSVTILVLGECGETLLFANNKHGSRSDYLSLSVPNGRTVRNTATAACARDRALGFWAEIGLSAVWVSTIFACFSTSQKDNVRGPLYRVI